MKTHSRLTLAFLFLILVVPQVEADSPPENGKHVIYYGNGQKEYEAHYKNGKLDGLSTWWYKNGQKNRESHYKNGKLDGLSTRWGSNGQKWIEQDYKDGVEISRKEF